MVTTEEIEGLPLFAALGPAERERLSRAAADISLLEGEHAVHEGDQLATRSNIKAIFGAEVEAVHAAAQPST